jgi:hypothetical protein
MRLRTVMAGMVAAGALGVTVLAPASQAAPCASGVACPTTATFVITAGALNISVPASTVALATGTINTGAASASGQLGSVSVADTRGLVSATWTTTVSSTTFQTGGGSANETVALNKIAYASGGPTSTTGSGSFTGSTLATMTVPGTAATWTTGVGNNTAAWNPTLTFTFLGTQAAGTYTGTVTHSVS